MPDREIVDCPLPTIHFEVVSLELDMRLAAKPEDHVIGDDAFDRYRFHNENKKGLAECMAPRALVGPLEASVVFFGW